MSGSPRPAVAARTPDIQCARIAAPFAVIEVHATAVALTRVEFLARSTAELTPSGALAERAAREIQRYLGDPEFRFELPLDPAGSAFRLRVWRALSAIPPGAVRTYGEIARALHSAARPVGQACGANPIPLIVPCHRVVGRQGLGGFMGAVAGDPIAIKGWLLRHEGAPVQ